MWNRKEMKREARASLKRNYWIAVLVCALMAFIFVEYGTSFTIIKTYNDAYKEVQQKASPAASRDGRDEATSALDGIMEKIGLKFGDQSADEDALEVTSNKGNLSGIVKMIQEKKGIETAVYDFISRIKNHDGIKMIMIGFFSLVLNIIFVIFITNMMIVGERRFFLENMNHPGTLFTRIFYLFSEKKVKGPVLTMFMKELFLTLWSLTIVGYFIKRYSYLMVPFILAENPDIGWRDAITLSRRMMDGYKWKAFIVDLSMWYWYLLKMLTAGFVGVFFLNPYSTSVYARIYTTVRAAAYKNNIENITLLNDDALYLPVDMETRPIHPAAVKEAAEARKTYERSYSLINLILFFFTFSLVGWLWEVNIHLVKDHMFVNRGTMYGPWLPIYGAGGLLVLLVLKKIREKKVLTFIMTMIVCGITEYFTSWYLEYTKGTKWWDYSGYLLNINGRVCLEGLLVFAIGGCAFIYFIAPRFDDLYNKIPLKVRWPIAGALLAIFSADMVYSHFHPNEGEGITDYGYEYDSEDMVSIAQPNEPARLTASQIPRLS